MAPEFSCAGELGTHGRATGRGKPQGRILDLYAFYIMAFDIICPDRIEIAPCKGITKGGCIENDRNAAYDRGAPIGSVTTYTVTDQEKFVWIYIRLEPAECIVQLICGRHTVLAVVGCVAVTAYTNRDHGQASDRD
jgi:hypothetical protein